MSTGISNSPSSNPNNVGSSTKVKPVRVNPARAEQLKQKAAQAANKMSPEQQTSDNVNSIHSDNVYSDMRALEMLTREPTTEGHLLQREVDDLNSDISDLKAKIKNGESYDPDRDDKLATSRPTIGQGQRGRNNETMRVSNINSEKNARKHDHNNLEEYQEELTATQDKRDIKQKELNEWQTNNPDVDTTEKEADLFATIEGLAGFVGMTGPIAKAYATRECQLKISKSWDGSPPAHAARLEDMFASYYLTASINTGAEVSNGVASLAGGGAISKTVIDISKSVRKYNRKNTLPAEAPPFRSSKIKNYAKNLLNEKKQNRKNSGWKLGIRGALRVLPGSSIVTVIADTFRHQRIQKSKSKPLDFGGAFKDMADQYLFKSEKDIINGEPRNTRNGETVTNFSRFKKLGTRIAENLARGATALGTVISAPVWSIIFKVPAKTAFSTPRLDKAFGKPYVAKNFNRHYTEEALQQQIASEFQQMCQEQGLSVTDSKLINRNGENVSLNVNQERFIGHVRDLYETTMGHKNDNYYWSDLEIVSFLLSNECKNADVVVRVGRNDAKVGRPNRKIKLKN